MSDDWVALEAPPDDQFNTTIYSYEDRLRGISGTRKVLLMHEADMRRLGILDGEIVDLVGESGDGVERLVVGFRATRYDVPRGNCVGYYPECNPPLPLWHHAKRSMCLRLNQFQSGSKSVPVNLYKWRCRESRHVRRKRLSRTEWPRAGCAPRFTLYAHGRRPFAFVALVPRVSERSSPGSHIARVLAQAICGRRPPRPKAVRLHG
jgi:hypothetical protein